MILGKFISFTFISCCENYGRDQLYFFRSWFFPSIKVICYSCVAGEQAEVADESGSKDDIRGQISKGVANYVSRIESGSTMEW